MTENRKIIRIADAISAISNQQIAIETTVDTDLNFKMWGGKDADGNVTKWLAKDKAAQVTTATLTGGTTTGSTGLMSHDTTGLLAGQINTMVELEAIVTDIDYINAALFDANTILSADTDNTPAALTVPEQTLIGRITSGNIDALTVSEVRTLLDYGSDEVDNDSGVTGVTVTNALDNLSTAIGALTLDDAYNADAGAANIDVDAGSVSWTITGAYDFNIDLGAADDTYGFKVFDDTDYFRLHRLQPESIILDAELHEANINVQGDMSLSGGNGLNLDFTTISINLRTFLTDDGTTFTILPATGDYVRIGDAATASYCTTNDDFHVSGLLEATGVFHAGGNIIQTTGGKIYKDVAEPIIIGDAGGTPGIVTDNDSLYVNNALEVDGGSYLAGAQFSANISCGSNVSVRSTAGDAFGSFMPRSTVQTIHTTALTTGTTSNGILICESGDTGFNFENALQTNPTLIWQNADANSIYGRGYIAHNNNDFTFQSHRGGFSFEVPAQYAQGTMTLTGLPTATDTFVINATTCTAVASGASTDEFNIGGTAAETITNIVAMIAAGTEAANVKAWDGAGDTVVFEWKTAGVNSIIFTESMSNCTVDGGGTLGGTHLGVAASTPLAVDENGLVTPGAMIAGIQGTDIASANDATLTATGNYFDVTGTTQTNTLSVPTGCTAGTIITLQFDGSVTVKHATAGAGAQFQLAGAGDFAATAGDTLQLVYDGTYWREISRTAI